MNTKLRLCIVGSLAFFTSALVAADRTYQNSGGDLSSTSTSDWGGTPPGDADKAIVDKSGEYTLSSDVTFGRFDALAEACFGFAGRKMTLTGSSQPGSVGLKAGKADGKIVFDGGVLDFSSTAHCHPLYNANDAVTVFTNGCIVTNVANFYAMLSAQRSKVEIVGRTKVYANELRVLNDSGSDDVLEIRDGGQMHVFNRIYSEAGGTQGAYGGNVLCVRDSGSQLKFSGGYDLQLGFQRNCNTIHAVDGGAISFSGNGGLLLGGGAWHEARTNNALVVERSATASFPKIISNSDHNRIFVGDGATLTMAKLRLSSSMNEIIVSNATFNCTAPRNSTDASKEGFNLATSATCTGNVFRLIGPSASLGTLPWPLYWFNSASHITFSIEDGAKWGDADTHFDALFSKEQHCTFRVTGAGTVFGDADGKSNRFYVCNKNAAVTEACASNVVEVSDGASFYASGVNVAGVDNALVVSNATVETKYLDPGWKSDDSSVATNCMVRLCGTSPKICIKGGSHCRFKNNSVLRFDVPKTGFAENHVPLELSCALEFDESCRIEVDCAEFVAVTGGKVHLVHAASISDEVKSRLLNTCALPAKCTLEVTATDVYLKSPRVVGFVISFW